MNENLVKALGATAEAMGQTVTKTALEIMCEDLEMYAEPEIAAGLKSLRRKNVRFCVANIIEQIQQNDGHPTADEAWTIAPKSEEDTAVLTPQIMAAWGVSYEQYYAGDEIGAQIAFKREYSRLLAVARENGEKPAWSVSLGLEPAFRADPIINAVKIGRLPAETAEMHLQSDSDGLLLLGQAIGSQRLIDGNKEKKYLSGAVAEVIDANLSGDEIKERIKKIRESL